MTITKGSVVKVHYTGTLDDGSMFDSSEGREPLEVEVGAGQVIKGFDDALLGMKEGDKKEIVLEAEDAYGMVNPELHKKVPRSKLPAGEEPKVGMMLGITLPTGQQIPARIIEVDEESITIDLNHPLAGKRLHFALTVVSV